MQKNSIKVLLINRESPFLDYISKHLRKAEIVPYQAINAEQALELAINDNFDVAVIDKDLPGIDSCVVYNELKELQPYLQAILLIDQDNIADSVLVKCNFSPFDYIIKPCDFNSLKQKIIAAYEYKKEQLKTDSENSCNQEEDSIESLGFLQKLRKWYSLPSECSGI